MTTKTDHGFFVGYFSNVPPAIATLCLSAGFALFALFVTAGLWLGSAGDATATGERFGGEEIEVTGTIRTMPYPLLLVPPDAQRPTGRTLMLSGEGKYAPAGLADGQRLVMSGFLMQRGTLEVLVVGKTRPAGAGGAAPNAQPMGRWRVSGEICDGKCASGAMHPGTGLAHKACANLCIDGALPPVLAMRQPVLGAGFLLLAQQDGGPVPAGFHDLTALPVELEGDIERLGDLLILKADWNKARAL